jgi:hypothetical protein
MKATSLTDLAGWAPARLPPGRNVAWGSRVVTRGRHPGATHARATAPPAAVRGSRAWYDLRADPVTERWELILSLLIWASGLVALLWN